MDWQQTAIIPSGFEFLKDNQSKFTKTFPHLDRNVFVMMPFVGNKLRLIYSCIDKTLREHGLIPLRADQRSFSANLWWNVLTYMIGSSYGIVVYEPQDKVPFNPNVSIEGGFMTALDRPILFLVNKELKKLPVDWSGQLFKVYDPTNIESSIEAAISDWILRDISYFDYDDKKVVLFVSLGGTCRCVLAKALLAQKLHDSKITTITTEAAAVAEPLHSKVSRSAIDVLKEHGCEGWIRGHRPRKLSRYLQNRADLIVLLTKGGLSRSSRGSTKVVTDIELFNRKISNPYPDKGDAESLERYRNTFFELKDVFDDKFEDILQRLDSAPIV